MGVAGSGPAYSLAATTAVLIGVVGVLAPASLLYCGLIMFGIVFAFRHLNSVDANAGATYSWLSSIFFTGDWVFCRLVGDRRLCLVYGIRHSSRGGGNAQSGGT